MTGPEARWRAALAEGRFLLQRSADGTAVFPPRLAAPGSGAPLDWVEASGRGTVYSVTVINRKPPDQPHAVVLVTLDEGPRLMSRVDGIAPDAIQIGMPVRARIMQDDGVPILVFDPA